MARLLLMTAGTEGDVRPVLHLAARAVRRGHAVTMVAPATDTTDVVATGASHVALDVDFRALARSGQAQAAGLPALRDRLMAAGSLSTVVDRLLNATARAVESRPDIILAHPKFTGAADLAQALGGVPWARLALLPCIAPTAAFPNAALISRSLGRIGNRLSYRLTDLLTRPLDRRTDRWREAAFGLPPRRSAPPPPASLVLNAFSAALLPPVHDWGPDVVTTGIWQAPPDEPRAGGLPAPAAAFASRAAARRRPLVHIGFGSMAGVDGAAVARSIARALDRADVAALVTTGWGGIDGATLDATAGDRVLVLDRTPHARIFPHVDLVVHHGGVGTLAAGLLAGRAAVICPWGADQPFWAEQARALGYGLRGPGLRALAADGGGARAGERLGHVIRQALRHRSLTDTAGRIGRRMAAEDGTGAALDALEWLVEAGAGR
ncbi:glycosyl transferase family 1 [Tistrella bauzanensis]|uniref:Glycosyl transferase family 1 n=1 Tax=Tistrella bauzanensis TaxID=657419 RepID=A0ABQ1J415_9PROT|nr:glycosyltransferase [Tistrella bauzanensis]GGB59523.1 glycosyl transferase family 1 [Tistrella bauzanensis]